ncbi:MAG: histidine phosphatase family protein [Clostridia bacterium]|nr:histidine phosphatase family protein [Clostridia bacterium]
MRWILIRHGETRGNAQKRYIGCRTDEPLSSAGIAALRAKRYPPVARVFSSPMKRCLMTADIIYPMHRPESIRDFRECDFGIFEGYNYSELKDSADYQRWIDSGGRRPFPGGESREAFAARCVRAFEALRARPRAGDSALVVHGGTIMAILEAFAAPHRDYFDYQTACGEGFILEESGSCTPLF